MKSHQKQAAGFIAGGFSIAILLISSVTTFGFFFIFFADLVPAGILDPFTSAMISGFVGVLLFDMACAIWLFTFLHHAASAEQRAIALIMTAVTFIGAASASVAYLGLTASADLTLAAETRRTIADGALVVVIMGVVVNFAAVQAYQRFSLENKQAVREADRLDKILTEQEKHERYFDDLVTADAVGMLEQMAPTMANEKALAVADAWRRKEEATLGKFQPGNGRQEIGYGKARLMASGPRLFTRRGGRPEDFTQPGNRQSDQEG